MGNQIGPCLSLKILHKKKPEAATSAIYRVRTRPADAVVGSRHGTGPQPVSEVSGSETGRRSSGSSSLPRFVCEICTESKALQDSFSPKGCVHFFCTECVVNYVVSKVSDNLVRHVPCPVPGCSAGSLDPDFCRGILPTVWFDRWGVALCDLAINGSEKFYCPYQNCSALLINDGYGNPGMAHSECPHCKRWFCVRCKDVWHYEMDCAKYQKLKKKGEPSMLADLAQRKKWKNCPSCKVYVEKTQGCEFMKCRCGTYFCYECGKTKKKEDSHYCTCVKRKTL